jgi:hypothetical protein
MRCRTGIVRNSELLTIPDQRHTAIAPRLGNMLIERD